jgi:hypothetical protein
MDIDTVECDLFRLPVPENVADSARGTLSCFESRLRQGVRPRRHVRAELHVDAGAGGSAILAMPRDDLTPALLGQGADAIEPAISAARLLPRTPCQ